MLLTDVLITLEKSWQLAEVDEEWQKANVNYLFKKERKEDPGNYRPLSLLIVTIHSGVPEVLFMKNSHVYSSYCVFDM